MDVPQHFLQYEGADAIRQTVSRSRSGTTSDPGERIAREFFSYATPYFVPCTVSCSPANWSASATPATASSPTTSTPTTPAGASGRAAARPVPRPGGPDARRTGGGPARSRSATTPASSSTRGWPSCSRTAASSRSSPASRPSSCARPSSARPAEAAAQGRGRRFDRDAVLRRASRPSLSLEPAAVEQGLFADLKSEQRLVKFKDISAEHLLERYNVALAQAVLLRAVARARHRPPRAAAALPAAAAQRQVPPARLRGRAGRATASACTSTGRSACSRRRRSTACSSPCSCRPCCCAATSS